MVLSKKNNCRVHDDPIACIFIRCVNLCSPSYRVKVKKKVNDRLD